MMFKQIFPISWKPTPLQEDLLRACLLKDGWADKAFGRWAERADIDHLDYESFRLVPLLWKNLSGIVSDPLMAKFKGIYRAAWTRNQLQLGRAQETLKLFSGEGIEAILLKGASLIQKYYEDPGVRPFDDFDVMVPLADAGKALDILLSNGWRSMYGGEPSHYLQWRHAINMVDAERYNIDLHWQLAWCMRGKFAPEPFWKDSLRLDFYGLPARILCPADLLMHILIHGARIGSEYGLSPLSIKLIRWIADAHVVIQRGDVNWDRLCDRAERYYVRLQVGKALEYLEGFYQNSCIPLNVVRRLLRRPARMIERFHYDATMGFFGSGSLFRVHKFHQTHFLTLFWQKSSYEEVDRVPWHQYLAVYIGYFREHYRLKHSWQVPFRLLWAFLKRPWRVVFGK